MTTKLIVLVSILSLTVASAASAQRVVFPPAPAVPAVPAAPAVPPVPYFDLHQIDLPRIELPHIELPHIEVPEVHIDFDAIRESAQMAALAAQPFNFQYQEKGQAESQYSQARQRIDNNQYERALEPLDRVIDAKGERADAALYWKAYSLMKLARRDDALSTLGQLAKQFPSSPWVKDARALEVEVKQAAGQNVSTDTADDELKLLALQGIMRSDPDAALPAVEKLLAGGGSVKLKERALFVLQQSRNDRATGIISNVARTNSNPDLQQRAIRILSQSNSPETVSTLTTVYRGADTSVETKKIIISSLASSRAPGAIAALVTLARAERNPEMKTSIVRYLSNSNSPEAKTYMIEILNSK
jgi:tetratricopeptide (TPR) repeat protein